LIDEQGEVHIKARFTLYLNFTTLYMHSITKYRPPCGNGTLYNDRGEKTRVQRGSRLNKSP